MSIYGYTRDSFLAEFFPDPDDRREVEAGADRLVATNRAYRLVERLSRVGPEGTTPPCAPW
jgi:hypothetical protein